MMNYCIDCKHFLKTPFRLPDECLRSEGERDMVYNRVEFVSVRVARTVCNGELFEPKKVKPKQPGLWTTLKKGLTY